MTSLLVTGSSNFSVIQELPLTVVARQCPIGDGGKIDLVVNGPLTYSYAPALDHYWFSSVPNEAWFSEYYRTQWGRIAHNKTQKKCWRDYLKKALGPSLPQFRSIAKSIRSLGKKSTKAEITQKRVERFIKADIKRSFLTFSPYLPDGGNVVEVGTGAGDFLRPFIDAGYRCMGFEPSPDSSALARANGINIISDFLADDDVSKAALSVADMVISNHSMEHHWDPNRFLSLWAQHMKHGAVLGITVPNANSEFLLMTHLFLLHLDSYTPFSLEMILNKHGFRVVDREIGSQLRFTAIKDKSVVSADPLISTSEMKFLKSYMDKFQAQLSAQETFSFKGSRPFYGMNYEVCEAGDYGARTMLLKIKQDNANVITYITSSPHSAMLVLK
jgi:SAM-dependent methyltransferase